MTAVESGGVGRARWARGAGRADARTRGEEKATKRRRLAARARDERRERRGAVVASAGAEREGEAGEVGRALFEDGVGVASFRGFRLVDEVTIELEVGSGGGGGSNDALEARRSGAGKVGMAGFDSAPGFASFSWLSDDEYEAYESTHDHDHDHDEDEEKDEVSTDEATSSATRVVVEETKTSFTATLGVRGDLSTAPSIDTETKLIYAGIAAAAALIGGRRLALLEGRVSPPLTKQPTTSVVAKKSSAKTVNATTAASGTSLERRAVSPWTKSTYQLDAVQMPTSVTRGASVAGVASAVVVAAAAVGVSVSGYSRQRQVSREMRAAPQRRPEVVDERSAQRRLELMRESMILEFEAEIERLGALKKEKNDNLKTLNDEFLRKMKGVELSALRQEAISGPGAGEQTAKELERLIVTMKAEHDYALKEKEAAFVEQEKAMQESMAKLQNALSIAETALREAQQVNETMTSRHEMELRAARGLIRAERELGRSEASKYRAAADLQRAHVAALRSDLALAKVTSSERLTFLQDQLKAICASYSERILRERAEFAAALEGKDVARVSATLTTEAEFVTAVAEIRTEAAAEVNALTAKYDSAMRSASGERRALKALFDSEMNKSATSIFSNESFSSQIQGELAAQEVAYSSRLSDAIREAQFQFDDRIAALKKVHRAELERLKSSSQSQLVEKVKALEEAHRVALNATSAAHEKALQEARVEADRRTAEAEARARESIATLETSDAAKAEIFARFEAERVELNSMLSREREQMKAEVESMKATYEKMLADAETTAQLKVSEAYSQTDALVRSAVAQVLAEKTELESRLHELETSASTDSTQLDDLKNTLAMYEKMLADAETSAQFNLSKANDQTEALVRSAVAQVLAEKAELESRLRELEASTSADNKKLEELKVTLAKSGDASSEIANLQKQLAERAAVERDLLNQIAAARRSAEAASQDASKSTSERDALKAQVARLESQLAEMRKSKEAYDKEVAALKASADKSVNATNGQKDAQIAELKAQLTMQSELLKEQKANAEQELLKAVAELQSEESRDLVRAVAELQFRETQSQAAQNASKEQLESSLRELNSLKAELAARGSVEDLSGVVSDLRVQLEKRAEIEVALRVEIDAAKSELQLLQTAPKVEKTRRFSLRRILGKLKGSSDGVNNSSTENFGVNDTRNETISEQQSKIESLESRIKTLESQKLEMQSSQKSYDAKILDLKAQLSKQSKSLEEQRKISEKELIEAVNKLKSEMQSTLNAELEKRNAVESSLLSQIDSANAALESIRNAGSSSESKQGFSLKRIFAQKIASDETAKIQEQQTKIVRLQSELSTLQKSQKSYDAEIKAIKALQATDKKQLENALRDLEEMRNARTSDQKEYDSLNGVAADLRRRLSEQSRLLREQTASAEKKLAAALADMQASSEEQLVIAIAEMQSRSERQLIEVVAEMQSDAAAEKLKAEIAARASAGERRALYSLMRNEALKQSAAAMVGFTAEVASTEARTSMYWEQKIREIEDSKRIEIESLRREYVERVAALESSSSSTKQVEALRKELEATKERAEKELLEAVAQLQARAQADMVAMRALVKSEADERISQAQTLFQEEKNALVKAHNIEIKTIENAARTSLARDETLKVKEAEDAWEAKIAEVERTAKEQMERSTAEYEATVKRLEARLEETEEGYELTIKRLNKALKKSADENEDRLRQEVMEARKELEAFKRKQDKRDAKTKPAETVKYTFEENSAELKRLKKQKDALQEKIDRLESEYAASNAVDASEYTRQIAALEAQILRTRAEHDQEMNSVKERMESERRRIECKLQDELDVARRAVQKAEDAYQRSLDQSKEQSRGNIFARLLRKLPSTDASVKAIEDKIRDQTALLTAAQNEEREAKQREDQLRKELLLLTAKLEQESKTSAAEISNLKKELSEANKKAMADFAAKSDALVKQYEVRIAELKMSSQQDTVAVVARLQSEAQQELINAVARITTEREEVAIRAEKKYLRELARLSEETAKIPKDFNETMQNLLDTISKVEKERDMFRSDSNAWKEQAFSYEEKVKALEAERSELLQKVRSANDAASASKAQVAAKQDELFRAVASTKAENDAEKIAAISELLRKLNKLEVDSKLFQSEARKWKDDARAYQEKAQSLASERDSVLSSLKQAQATFASAESKLTAKEIELVRAVAQRNADIEDLAKKHEEDLVRAVSQTMADAALAYNDDIQKAAERAKQADASLAEFKRDFDNNVREAAKALNKDLKQRERDLERKLAQAQRDYAEQAKKMENVQYRLDALRVEYQEAEAKWARTMQNMKDDFERRAEKDRVTLAEKIAFYEQRISVLSEELTVAKKRVSSQEREDRQATVRRPLFEFNKGKIAAAQARADDAERQLLAASTEMQALRAQLLESELRAAEAQAAADAALEEAKEAKKPTLFDKIFGALNDKRVEDVESRLRNVQLERETQLASLKDSYEQRLVDLKSAAEADKAKIMAQADSGKVKALEQELQAAAKRLSELKTASLVEVEAAKKATRDEYESKLRALEAKATDLEKQLADAQKVANEQLESAMKAAKAERDRVEKALRGELAAAKKLADDARTAAQREFTVSLREAEAKAKRDLREQAKKLASERAEAEAAIRESSNMANDKLKEKIANFENMLNEQEREIEARFNAQFDKLVVDFRREVEKLQNQLREAESAAFSSSGDAPRVIEKVIEVEKIVEKIVEVEKKSTTGDSTSFATELNKNQEELATLRSRSERDIAELRATYEARLQEVVQQKDLALKEARQEALEFIARERAQAEEMMRSQMTDRERQLEIDRDRLERSFEKTVTERDSLARELEILKASLSEAKRRLREFVDLSDEELKVLEESKRVAGELDSIKLNYARQLGLNIPGDSAEEDDGFVAERRRRAKPSPSKSAADYFKQLLDMSSRED